MSVQTKQDTKQIWLGADLARTWHLFNETKEDVKALRDHRASGPRMSDLVFAEGAIEEL